MGPLSVEDGDAESSWGGLEGKMGLLPSFAYSSSPIPQQELQPSWRHGPERFT